MNAIEKQNTTVGDSFEYETNQECDWKAKPKYENNASIIWFKFKFCIIRNIKLWGEK